MVESNHTIQPTETLYDVNFTYKKLPYNGQKIKSLEKPYM